MSTLHRMKRWPKGPQRGMETQEVEEVHSHEILTQFECVTDYQHHH